MNLHFIPFPVALASTWGEKIHDAKFSSKSEIPDITGPGWTSRPKKHAQGYWKLKN